MSIKKQEEEVKLLTETCKTLFTLFLTLSGGLIYIGRTFFDKATPLLRAVNGMILFLGTVIDIGVIIILVSTWIKIKKIIKEL
jgi:hypothetical protein